MRAKTSNFLSLSQLNTLLQKCTNLKSIQKCTNLKSIQKCTNLKSIQKCTNLKSIQKLKQTHQQIIVNGQDQNPFIVTKLVQLYFDLDLFKYAHQLFDKLTHPNVFAWSAVISYYSRHGLSYNCIGCYKKMKMSWVFPDKYVFPKVLRACAQNGELKLGSQVHKDVIFFGVESNVLVCNSLIDMYCKCGDIESGTRVFSEMRERDVLSWNSMISGCLSCGFVESAVDLFCSMRLQGFDPDLVSYNTTMDAYLRMGKCNEALKIFEQIEEPSIVSWTILISGYSRIGDHLLSLSVFRKMVCKGKVFPDLDCISSVIVSCRHLGSLINGEEMHAYGVKMDKSYKFYKSAGPALLATYAKCRKVLYCTNLFNLMDKSDVVTWNAMILGFADMGKEALALQFFREMKSISIESDQTTISTVLPVCDLESGEQIHAQILKTGFNLDIPILNALIHMYCKCGCINTAYSVFSNMFSRDLVSWNTMIGGFARHGYGKPALQLLEEMNNFNIFPNSVTFTSLLSACNHSGFVDEGIGIFNKMINEFDINPRMEHYACVVDLMARSGRLEEVVDFINKMNLKPDKCIWGALLAASQSHQNVSVAILASEKLVRLEPEYAAHYVTLANIYVEAGRWDDSVEVRRLMESRGLVKPSGYSWVES